MSLGKIIKLNGGFKFMELDEIDIGQAVERVTDLNTAVWKHCVKKAVEKGSIQDKKLPPRQVFDLALAFFNAACLKGYTVLVTELDRKIHIAKEEANAEPAPESREQLAETQQATDQYHQEQQENAEEQPPADSTLQEKVDQLTDIAVDEAAEAKADLKRKYGE